MQGEVVGDLEQQAGVVVVEQFAAFDRVDRGEPSPDETVSGAVQCVDAPLAWERGAQTAPCEAACCFLQPSRVTPILGEVAGVDRQSGQRGGVQHRVVQPPVIDEYRTAVSDSVELVPGGWTPLGDQRLVETLPHHPVARGCVGRGGPQPFQHLPDGPAVVQVGAGLGQARCHGVQMGVDEPGEDRTAREVEHLHLL
jgi:hypothetical protein